MLALKRTDKFAKYIFTSMDACLDERTAVKRILNVKVFAFYFLWRESFPRFFSFLRCVTFFFFLFKWHSYFFIYRKQKPSASSLLTLLKWIIRTTTPSLFVLFVVKVVEYIHFFCGDKFASLTLALPSFSGGCDCDRLILSKKKSDKTPTQK